jgi:hypothetical integral membrane protein (TIGR02206 family)
MNAYQIGSLFFILLVPAVVWWIDRCPHRAALVRLAERALAVSLILALVGELAAKALDGTFTFKEALPLQLCDWALFATSAALWGRWRAGFEVAYFWGIGGTLQAIFTPAIEDHLPWWRVLGFFFIHAGIVAGVVHLLLTPRFRPVWPRSLIFTAIVSEVYLACALAANALTGGNYGFLSHKPSTRSMLDLFSDTPWLYVAQVNLVAFVFFALLYLPWLFVDRRAG